MEDMNKQDGGNTESERKSAQYILIFAVAAVVIFAILVLNLAQAVTEKKTDSEKRIVQTEKAENTLYSFQNLSGMIFDTAEGSVFTLPDENVSVLVYWASWCPHCKESLKALTETAKDMEKRGASVYLINKLDGTKETKESAQQFLKQNNIILKSLFDTDCINYNEIGLHMIPTTIILDKNKNVTSYLEGSVPDRVQAAAMIAEAGTGKTALLESFIEEGLMNEEGGVRTTFLEQEAGIPSGSDVLSESQGIIMEYSALKGDRELFEHALGYMEPRFFPEGLAPWVFSDKQEANVNALVDDLRILKGLITAEQKWGEYQELCKSYAEAIYTYNVEEDRPVDFYDFKSKIKTNRFTLCYGDLETLSELQKLDKKYLPVYENTLELIKGGRISEEFPLYYNYYDYSEGKYIGGDLHMAEAFTALLHLAQVGELPEGALKWLEKRLDEGVIYAVYGTDGKPAAEGYFESTAVYALAVRIALEAGREDIAAKALNKMEQFKVRDIDSEVNGAFGGSDGNGIYSFDQGMALLAYKQFESQLN